MSQFNINEDAQSGGEYSGSQSPTNDSQPNVESSAFPDEDEETITMLDVIEREDKLEEEASAVLGYSDEKNCTYPKGYITRQALYSCKTCSDENDNKHAAICLACSLECHDNHEVYELYTKRNFRCDCGNSKFKSNFECKLIDKQIKKAPLNEKNKYNHNFWGHYCVCDRRYPPDENDNSVESNDEMWQCIICEDWYHSKHLNSKELPNKFEELICGGCVEKLDFINYYRDIEKIGEPSTGVSKISINNGSVDNNNTVSATTGTQSAESDSGESVSQIKNESDSNLTSSSAPVAGSSKFEQPVESSAVSATNNCESDTNDSQAENKDPGSKTEASIKGSDSDEVKIEEKTKCILDELKRKYVLNSNETTTAASGATTIETNMEASTNSNKLSTKYGPIFWASCDWRTMLCRCHKCLDLYKERDCEYLLDEKDTVQYYEAQGKAMAKNAGSPFERGMSALNRMNRAAVVEALHGYDELKADLSDYLRKFADSKKVVREEDIHEFFSRLKSKKRPRFDREE